MDKDLSTKICWWWWIGFMGASTARVICVQKYVPTPIYTAHRTQTNDRHRESDRESVLVLRSKSRSVAYSFTLLDDESEQPKPKSQGVWPLQVLNWTQLSYVSYVYNCLPCRITSITQFKLAQYLPWSVPGLGPHGLLIPKWICNCSNIY